MVPAGNKNDETLKRSVTMFINKNFPTDRASYKYRLPFCGFILSLLSLQYCIYYFSAFFDLYYLFVLSYILTALGVSLGLHWGLSIGDRKQYTAWIIFKVLEIILTFSLIIFAIVELVEEDYAIVMTVTGLIFTAINLFLTTKVIFKSLRLTKTTNNFEDENVYEFTPDNPV